MSFGVPVRNGIGIGLKASTSLSTRGGAGAAPPGQQAFTTPGTYSWVAPAGVTSVSAVCVGAGGFGGFYNTGGCGGGLGWKNNISVTPGVSYTVLVGAPASTAGPRSQESYFINATTVKGGGGGYATTDPSGRGDFVGDGGGFGGVGGFPNDGGIEDQGGGGGAGGYVGNGGAGSFSGTGGLGGGGAGGRTVGANTNKGGGGVGILGQGSNGVAPSGGGSGGTSGTDTGGIYGGGAGGTNSPGGIGAVRIIWGAGRAFPATNTGNL